MFARHVDLPRGAERERVRDRGRTYTLRGSESRTLATVGAFRVVSSSDLRDHDGSRANIRSGDLRRLREQGLIETDDVREGAAFCAAPVGDRATAGTEPRRERPR